MPMLSPTDEISILKIFTKPQVAALKKRGCSMISDLLLRFPARYLDFSRLVAVAQMKAGFPASLEVEIKHISQRHSWRGRISLAEAVVSDDSGSIKCVWFNQGYLAQTFAKGEKVFLSGTPEYFRGSLQLTNPVIEKVSDFPLHTARLVPVYRLPEPVFAKTYRRAVRAALPAAPQLQEPLPQDVLARQGLPNLEQVVKLGHFPNTEEEAELARRRLAFEEIFYTQLLAQQQKIRLAKEKTAGIPFNQELVKSFLSRLPFQLTAWQKKAAWDIFQDLEKTTPMNRLLEGDVGSGKTLVALLAALETMHSGRQAAFLAPTEILAQQHYDTALKLFAPAGFGRECAILTGSLSRLGGGEISKSRLAALIKEGMPGLYIGTHALLQEKIKFSSLALVIIDEQHRFGVAQRSSLLREHKPVPHLLSLSATPIPRTLQLAAYGELDVSRIKSKPAGRKPITTKVIEPAQTEQAYRFIAGQVALGRQAFVVTPLIEENDRIGAKAAKAEHARLEKIFPDLKIGLMHGRLSAKEKESVMRKFLANDLGILVSTSVVEVGVDVPNATVMAIEGAERFGLAQLHQFRGRVGRADHQSYCLLFASHPNRGAELPEETQKRLLAFAQTQDGFELAELDLRLRGFGELYGREQTGWKFSYFSPDHAWLIEPARKEAAEILRLDSELEKFPLLEKQIAGKTVHFE